jgi:prevent-host-death family protein
MRQVNMHEAKTHLSRLVEQAANGEPFVIARAGKPLVKVVPIETPAEAEKPKLPRLGFMRGQFSVPDDFDTMFADEIRRMFEGDENDSVRRILEGRDG